MREWPLVLAAITVVFATTTVRGEPAEQLSIRVLVVNRADARSDIVQSAQVHSARIFTAIGIDLHWINMVPDAQRTEQPYDLKVTIIPESRTNERGLILGTAERSEDDEHRVAYVFYGRIRNLANLISAHIDVLLGQVIAHEIGHLLLPYGSHTSYGIMSNRWDRARLDHMRKGLAAFTPEQAELIRARLRSRSGRELHTPY